MSTRNRVVFKDPDAVKDYPWDWSKWLQQGEIIDRVDWIVPDGITDSDTTFTDTSATIWLSGGSVGYDYPVTCRITTNQGRTDDQTRVFKIRNQ